MIPQNDPYTLENFQQAYDNLASGESNQILTRAQTEEFTEAERLEPTHYALRIYPKIEEEQRRIEMMDDVDYIYTPFNYSGLGAEEAARVPQTRAEVTSPFEVSPYTVTYYYTNSTDGGPTGPVTYQLPILYTVWPVDKPLPDDLEYKLDYEVFMPQYDVPQTRSSMSLQMLEAEAVSLALGVPVVELQSSTRVGSNDYVGRLVTYDETLGANAPLSQLYLKLQLGTFISWGVVTDLSGNFSIPFTTGGQGLTVHLYYEHPSRFYRILLDDITTTVVTNLGRLYDVLPADPWGGNSTSDVVVPQDDRQATEIYRAANYFFNSHGQNFFPRTIPTGGLRIVANNFSKGTTLGAYTPSNRIINIYNSNQTDSRIVGTTLHEIGHCIQHNVHPTIFNTRKEELLIESFAPYVGWYLGEAYYKSLGWIKSSGALDITGNARQGWMKTTTSAQLGYYSPLFIDLTDDYNQKLSSTSIHPNDLISGVLSSSVWNIVSTSINYAQARQKIETLVGSQPNFDEWIGNFDYWISKNY
jgi:hypothetical protein